MHPETIPTWITVTRCRDGAVEGQFQAHRLSLPDGRDGVRWSGLAFPLHPGDRIEVTDIAMLPGECRPWSPRPSGWRVVADPGSADAYVFVDGPASARDNMAAAITAAGLQAMRTGPNMSSTPGDWFIRVRAWNDDATQLIGGLLGPAAQAAATESTELRERLLQERFEQVVGERDALRRELADARVQLQVAIGEAEAGGAMLTELQTLIDAMQAAKSQREQIQAVPEPGPSRRPNSPSDRDVATVIQYLLPRIELVRRSLAFVCVELADRAGLWRGLAELDRNDRGTPPSWKIVRGADGWIERHFSNGQDNQGRLYARYVVSRWQVLVSHKQDQPSDLQWLRQPG